MTETTTSPSEDALPLAAPSPATTALESPADDPNGLSAPSDAPSQGQDQAAETARTAGRGFLVITAAKLYFMVTGALIQLGLPILFGAPEQFGVFKIVTEAISLLNMVVITGTLQSVSKLVSEQPSSADQVVSQALRLQLVLGIPMAALYALLSPVIAAELFHDEALSGLMRLSSLIIAFYAFYAIFVGYLNGVKSFVRQATLDITFQTLKTVGILGLVVMGFGVMGSVAGFVGSAGAIMIIAGVWTLGLMRRARADGASQQAQQAQAQLQAQAPLSRLKRLGSFIVLVMLYTFALNGLMRIDLFMIKSIASAPPEALAPLALAFKDISDKFAGIYGAALNIARLPFQGVIAVTFVIFPLISESTFQADRERTRAYIEETFRYCSLLIAAVALPLLLNSDSVIAALYSADYQAASVALAIMNVGIIAFALLYVAMTIIIGAGKPLVACAIMGVSLALCAALNGLALQWVHQQTLDALAWAPLAPSSASGAASAQALVAASVDQARHHLTFAAPYLLRGPLYMQAAASATTLAMIAGFVMAMGWLWRAFDARPPVATLLRLALAAAVLFGVDLLFPSPVEWVARYGKLVYLLIVAAKMTTMGLALLLTLALTREVQPKDRERFMAVIKRRKKAVV